jgi:ABC-type multidrug transport system ATPase subunit
MTIPTAHDVSEDHQQEALLRFASVTKLFGGRGVRDLTLDVPAGTVTGVIGLNGSGKTTLLRLAAGILRPARGSVAGPRANRIAWVEEDPALYLDRIAADYLRLFTRLRGLDVSQAEESLARWGLQEQASSMVRTLSRGQRRRLALARGFLGKPDLFLLDEPWSGLDGQWHSRCTDAIAAARSRGASVMFTSHAVEEADGLADQLVVLWGGRIIVYDKPDRALAAIRRLWVHEFDLESQSNRRVTRPVLDASFVATEIVPETAQVRIVSEAGTDASEEILTVLAAAGLDASVAGAAYPLANCLLKR